MKETDLDEILGIYRDTYNTVSTVFVYLSIFNVKSVRKFFFVTINLIFTAI